VDYPRLLIQYIRSYPSHMEAVFSILNLRTRHAVVTRDPLNAVAIDYSRFQPSCQNIVGS
jgi:hypothetical protein